MEKRYKIVNNVEVFEEVDPVFAGVHMVPCMTFARPDGVIPVRCQAGLSLGRIC